MKRLLAVLLLLLWPAVLCAQPPQSGQPKPLAFTHVTMIDATGAPANPDMILVIIGDRITEIGKSGRVPLPKDAHVLDAAGKFRSDIMEGSM